MDDAILDDEDRLLAADKSGVLIALAGAGAQVRQAMTLTHETPVSSWAASDRPRSVVVAARGGAAFVADALLAILGTAGVAPVVPVTGDSLPAWVGPADLVLTASLSGESSGTVAVAGEAGRRGCLLLSVGMSGSSLEQATRASRGAYVALPEAGHGVIAIPTSRSGLWSMLVPALIACEQLGLLRDESLNFETVADILDKEAESNRPGLEMFVNPAKKLASDLADAIPVFLGNDAVTGVAAQRAASVFSRTARVPAIHGALPDAAGNIVATFGGPFAARSEADIFADPVDGVASRSVSERLVLLGSSEGRTGRAVMRIAQSAGVANTVVTPTVDCPVSALAQLVARLDFAAVYLALGNDIDPGVNPYVADLRHALS